MDILYFILEFLHSYVFIASWLTIFFALVGAFCFLVFSKLKLHQYINVWYIKQYKKYGIWRVKLHIIKFFDFKENEENRVPIQKSTYKSCSNSNNYKDKETRLFKFISSTMPKPKFCPKLNDYFIYWAIEEIYKSGKLIKAPTPDLGNTMIVPKESDYFTFKSNLIPEEQQMGENEAEIEQNCAEFHFKVRSDIGACPLNRYETDYDNMQVYKIDNIEECQKCWAFL